MSFSGGDLFQIEMRNGIYQVLALYGSDDKGKLYYFRKVFDGKLNQKISKAEIVHESWMRAIGKKTQEKLSAIISDPAIKATLDDLSINRAMQFGTGGIERVEIFWCTMDPKNKKKLEEQINGTINGFLNPFMLRNTIKELHMQGKLHIEYDPVSPPEGKRLYRIELGRYCDDFDEFGTECFREMRFHERKFSDDV